MSAQSDIAFAHQRQLIALGKTLALRSAALWRTMDLNALDASWQQVAPKLVRQVSAAQLAAAEMATPYVDQMDDSYDFDAKPTEIVPAAFAGVMGDGREIAPALFGAVTNTKTAIGRGVSPQTAFEAGANFISAVASAAMHDMARNADRVVSSGKGYVSYIRVVNGSACSRCAILAGVYSSEEAFRRHVSCQCCTAPIPGVGKSVPSGFHDTPQAYFDSLSKAEQDRRFTNSGAEAIRQGANPVSVVNARRGAYGIGFSGHGGGTFDPVSTGRRLQPITIGVKADGSPLKVYATREGVYRGNFRSQERRSSALAIKDGRYTRTTTVRLMPEQIQKMAGSNSARYVELLGRYGYLN